MAEYIVRDYYPTVYYLFNGVMGHEDFRSHSSTRSTQPAELLLPDRTMAKTTADKAKSAGDIATALKAVKTEDELMKQRLTVFSDVPADVIPDTFKRSRLAVSEKEHKVLEVAASLYAKGLIYLPTGRSRSWPYMDALARAEQEAFGLELKALEAKNTSLANHELDRELSELEDRITYAQQGSYVLQ